MAKFFVIDGLDGCGKQTQVSLLKSYLEGIGKRVIVISFPCYESDSSKPVQMYLNGEMGTNIKDLNPYACSSFYAVDRYIQYKKDWGRFFEEDDNTIILADRYISANIIHQGVKLQEGISQCNFAEWCYDFEVNKYGLPREDLTIVLTVKPEISQKLLSNRYNADETKKDIHESDLNYLNECYNYVGYISFAINMSCIANWVHYDCTLNDSIDTIENIHEHIKSIVSSYLE